ncbi:hypothetical protein F5883DRAFT_100429 [Diaporthe sp. PMI_573]|nr:hypothetical protein F5883DRAFT_100429 [Diaporthaceae sp. PMI_573]
MYTRVTRFHGRDSLCIYAVLGAAYLGRCFGGLQFCACSCGPIRPDWSGLGGVVRKRTAGHWDDASRDGSVEDKISMVQGIMWVCMYVCMYVCRNFADPYSAWMGRVPCNRSMEIAYRRLNSIGSKVAGNDDVDWMCVVSLPLVDPPPVRCPVSFSPTHVAPGSWLLWLWLWLWLWIWRLASPSHEQHRPRRGP